MRGIEAAFCGFLARNAEARTTKAGNAMAVLNVGVPDGGEAGAGDVAWLKVLAFNELAEGPAQALTKGAQIYVEGQLKLERWATKKGQERTGLTVLARLVQPLGQIARRRQAGGYRGDRARCSPEERARTAAADHRPDDLDDRVPW